MAAVRYMQMCEMGYKMRGNEGIAGCFDNGLRTRASKYMEKGGHGAISPVFVVVMWWGLTMEVATV